MFFHRVLPLKKTPKFFTRNSLELHFEIHIEIHVLFWVHPCGNLHGPSHGQFTWKSTCVLHVARTGTTHVRWEGKRHSVEEQNKKNNNTNRN